MKLVAKDKKIVDFLKVVENQLRDWSEAVRLDNPFEHKSIHNVVNLDTFCDDIQLITEHVKIEHVLDSIFGHFEYESRDGVTKIIKIGSVFGHFVQDEATGILKIYANKHKGYPVELHNIVAVYRVDARRINTVERIYVQANRIFCLGNSSDDEGRLSNLDQGGNSNIRLLYAVPVSLDFRESVAKAVRYNPIGTNNLILTYSTIIVNMILIESIGQRCVGCIPCRAVFRFKHDHKNRYELSDSKFDVSDFEELTGSERRLIPKKIREIFDVEMYEDAVEKTIGLVTKKIEDYASYPLSSKRIKVFSGKPFFKYIDYPCFYKSIHEKDTFYSMDYLIQNFKDSEGNYCCILGDCERIRMIVSKKGDLERHLIEQHFETVSRDDLIDMVVNFIDEERISA